MKTNRTLGSRRGRRRSGALLILLLSLLPWPSLAQVSHFGTLLITASASPRRVTADGQTRSRLRITLRTVRGEAAPDNTLVVVHTDLGYLTTTGADRVTTVSLTSQGGFASVWMVSDVPGAAVVSINAADSRTETMVEFLPPGQAGIAETHIARVGGGWVAFATELNVVEARDKAWAHFGQTRLEGADALQIEVDRMILRGGPAKLTNGKQTLEADDFYLQLDSKRGAARRLTEAGVERITFDLYSLEPREMDWKIPEDAFVRQRQSSITWLKAREIQVFSHEKIVFRNASLWTENSRIMSLPPIWIMALPGYTGSSNSQIVGLNSVGGVAVRFPWFVSAGSTTTDAINIQKGASASSISARDDWALGLTHEYRSGGTSGTIEASGLPYDDWGIRWRDTRISESGLQTDADLSSPDHESLYLDTNLYDYRGGASLSLRSFYQRPVGFGEDYGATAEWLTDPARVARSPVFYYRLGASLGVQTGGLGLGQPVPNRAEIVGGVHANVDARPLRLGRNTTLTPGLSDRYFTDTRSMETNSLRGSLRLDHSFGPSADLSLYYSALHQSGDMSNPGWRQLLTMDSRVYNGRTWMAYASGSLDLTTGDWFTYATWDYYLSRSWRLQLLGTWYDFDNQPFDDQEIYVGAKVFQEREIGLSWSRQTNKLSLELTGLTTTF